jgi:hypothetical protein
MPSTYTVLQSKLAAYGGCFQDKATQAYGPAVTVTQRPGARRADSESLTGAAWPPQAVSEGSSVTVVAYCGCFQDKVTQANGPAVTQRPGARRADSESLTGAAWPPQAQPGPHRHHGVRRKQCTKSRYHWT